MNWAFVSPPGVSLCSSEGVARIEMCLPDHVEEGSPTWESALESIELSLGMGDIQDCFHRLVLDDEFASNFWVDAVFASELSLSGSCLDGVLLDDHSEVDLLWCCLPMGFSWSLFFVQMTNEKIMSSCLGPAGFHIMNDRTLPAIFTAFNGQKKATGSNHFVFVDNLGVFGVGKASLRDRLCEACESFDKRGVKTQ